MNECALDTEVDAQALEAACDDESLMLHWQQGDGSAFEQLYQRHKGPVYRYFLRQGMSAADAAELHQETWSKLIRACDRWRPEAAFTTYLFTLARNCLIDFQRRNKRLLQEVAEDEALPAAAQEDAPGELDRTALMERIGALVAGLPAPQREVFLFKQEGGLSLAQIAELTDSSAESVKSRWRYAVDKLRQGLQGYG